MGGIIMLNYIKSNGKVISKLILNQVGIAIFGMVITSAVIRNQTLTLVIGILAVVFYLYLTYNTMWTEGAKERLKIEGGTSSSTAMRGFAVSLIAAIPNFILYILIQIGDIFGNTEGAFAYAWAGSLKMIAGVVARFYEGMYYGLITLYSPYNPIGFLVIIFPAVIVAGFAYYMGINNRYLAPFMHKKDGKRDTRTLSQLKNAKKGSQSSDQTLD